MGNPGKLPIPPSEGYEVHLDLGAIEGESESSLHTDEIEVDSVSWSVANQANRAGGVAGSKGGRPSLSEITITKSVDKASAQLFNATTNGTVFKTATISWSKSTGGGKPQDYMVWTLTNVYVTSVQVSSANTGANMGHETINLNYQKISIDYKIQTDNGLLVSGSSATYDLGSGSTK